VAFTLLLRYFSVIQINLIAYTHFDGVWSLVFLEHEVPSFEVLERGLIGDIVDHDCAVDIFHVVWDEASEALLSGGIPQLDSELLAVAADVLNMEINSNSGLYVSRSTLSPSSNLSLIYFSIMEDLPTDWSPRNIILYLVLPPPIVLVETLI